MQSEIWKKYTILEKINSNSNIKTYLSKKGLIIKEIIPNNLIAYCLIKNKFERLKNKVKIYDIIEENNKIYIVIDNNKEIISKIDELVLSTKLSTEKEGIINNQGNPVTKEEIMNLIKKEKSICKINYEIIEDNEIKKGRGTGFFCEISNFPIKYALFTNSHILNEDNINFGNIINIEYYENSLYKDKEIEINNKRRRNGLYMH